MRRNEPFLCPKSKEEKKNGKTITDCRGNTELNCTDTSRVWEIKNVRTRRNEIF